jgi:hypothetical protein
MVKKIQLTSFETNEKFEILSNSLINITEDKEHNQTLLTFNINFMEEPENRKYCLVKETEEQILKLIHD